jgi:hypothetical protein
MRERLIALRERRSRLIESASAEREVLAGYLARAEAATVWLDKGRWLLAEAKQRPWWIALGVAALVALQPKRSLRWLARGWSLWQAYRSARRWARRIVPSSAAPLASQRNP